MSFAIAGTVLTVGATAYAANRSNRAAQQQTQAADQANAESARQYDQTRADFEPWRVEGQNALARLGNASTGDTSGFTQSPDYNFVRSEGTRGIERTAAARGGAFSGNALRALAEFNSGLASQEYGNWWNRQAGLAGVGQAATGSVANAGTVNSQNQQQNALYAGSARASGIENQANIIGQGVNGLAGLWGYNSNRNKVPQNYPRTPGFGE